MKFHLWVPLNVLISASEVTVDWKINKRYGHTAHTFSR